MKCPSCNERESPIHPQYGVVWCEECKKKYKRIGKSIEIVDESTKEDRKKYFKSLLQPYRRGQLSREYIEAHGTKGINPTPEEVRKSKHVWKDLKGWRTRNKSI